MGQPECECPVAARSALSLQYASIDCHLPVHALLPVVHIPMSLLVSTAVSRGYPGDRYGPKQRAVNGAETGLRSHRGTPARVGGAGHRTALLAGAPHRPLTPQRRSWASACPTDSAFGHGRSLGVLGRVQHRKCPVWPELSGELGHYHLTSPQHGSLYW